MFLAGFLLGFLPGKIFLVHALVKRAELLDKLAQFAQMAFAVRDFFVNDDTIKAFLRWLGQEFFRDGDVFLRGEPKSVDDAFHRDFGFLDLLADLDFLFAGEQGNLAHLVHVHANRVIQNFET